MRRPLPPIVLFFCLGLIVAHCFAIPFVFVSISCLVFFLFPILFLFLKKRIWATLISFLLFFILGIISLHPHTYQQYSPSQITHLLINKRVNLEGVVDTSPFITKNRTRLFLKTIHIHTRDGSFSVNGRVMISIRNSKKIFRYGDRIRFYGYLRQPQNFENPGKFDYVRFLAYQSVFFTTYLHDDSSIIKIREGDGNRFLLWVEAYRGKIRTVINEQLSSPGKDILKALILGEKGTIPDSIKEQFAKLGIAHLLAISGLHIGIVTFVSFIFFMTLLKLNYRILLYTDAFKISVFLSIFPVIFYCFIAGFHLPTLRAFLMIIAYMVALLLGRRQDLLSMPRSHPRQCWQDTQRSQSPEHRSG